MDDTAPKPFSRPFDLAGLDDRPETITITATEVECAAVAAAFGLLGIAALAAHLRLARAGRDRVDIRLDLTATVTQTCVVSADPFEQTVAERAALRVLTSQPDDAPVSDLTLDPEEPDEIPIPGTTIDLGALATEQLALALDPYPRKPGAEAPTHEAGELTSRFAALASLRTRHRPDDTPDGTQN